MADDINKKISIDVEVSTDRLQQLNLYQTAITNLTTAVKALGKPLADTSNSLLSLNSGIKQVAEVAAAATKAINSNLVSAINVAYGGRDFSVPNVSKGYAVGGIFTDGGNPTAITINP